MVPVNNLERKGLMRCEADIIIYPRDWVYPIEYAHGLAVFGLF